MHEAQIRVAIAGAGGRMGRQLIQPPWRWKVFNWVPR